MLIILRRCIVRPKGVVIRGCTNRIAIAIVGAIATRNLKVDGFRECTPSVSLINNLSLVGPFR